MRKTEGDDSLQALIKNTNDDFFSDRIMEVLEKMAEDKRRPRSSNKAIQHFGDYSLDNTGDTSNMIHDALSHHASHYKAALKSDQKHLASQHMRKIHNIMHFSRKLGNDGALDHSGGKLKIEAVDPKPWERSGFPNVKEGTGKFSTDTKGWSRDGGSYDYMQLKPHDSYAKETQGHGHNNSYPLEEIKVNGKHLHIDDDIDLTGGYKGHEFDEHPILKNGMYKKSPQSIDEKAYDQYLKDIDDYESSDHLTSYYDRHDKLQQDDPDGYASRGTEKPGKILPEVLEELKEKAAEEKVEEKKPAEGESDLLSQIHSELTDEERNHPENKKLLNAVGSGAFNLDKETVLSIIRGGHEDVKKSLVKIKDSLIKNKDFLKQNPSILLDIRNRLVKATDDDAEKWLQENDTSYDDDQYSDQDESIDYNEDDDAGYGEKDVAGLFDAPEDAADENVFDDEDKYMVETEKPELVDINEADKPKAEPIKEAPQKEKGKRSSSYAEWKPRDDYSPEQQKRIKELVTEGYHPGDAEILAGAHQKHMTMKDAVTHRVHPHEMSDLMHGKLKDLADLHMNDIVAADYDIAEPEFNPQKATTGTIKSYNDLMQDFRDKKDEFYASDEVKGMSPRDRHAAFKEWKENYHNENPNHTNALKEEWNKHGKVDKENWEKRKGKLEEDRMAIAQSGQIDTEGMGSLSSGSRQMAEGPDGEQQDQTIQGAYQSAGMSTSEEGGQSGGSTVKDPYATFAEKNPKLKAKYMKSIENSLDDSGKTRLKRINTIKGS